MVFLLFSAALLIPQAAGAKGDDQKDARIFKNIRNDHKEIAAQIDKIGKAGPKDRAEDFAALKKELVPHMRGEEMVFYKDLQEKPDAQQDVAKAAQEHRAAEKMLADLESMPQDAADFPAKLGDFKKAIMDHVKFEEGALFGHAEKDFNHDQLKDINTRFMQQKQTEKQTMSGKKL